MYSSDMMHKNARGLTLVESLVSVFILTILLIGLLSTFFLAKTSALHAKHRMAAMNLITQYMEQEIRARYDGGSDGESDYYATVTNGNPIQVTIDDRGTTADTSDDLTGTITPDPYFPDNIENPDGTQIAYAGIPYKIIGFVVRRTEDRVAQESNERAYCNVSYHSGA